MSIGYPRTSQGITSSTVELEEQLSKMCQDVLAKQALLEQVVCRKRLLSLVLLLLLRI